MIAGHNSESLFNDFKYNITNEQIIQLAECKKIANLKIKELHEKLDFSKSDMGLTPKEKEELDVSGRIRDDKRFINEFLPTLYNTVNGNETSDLMYKNGVISKDLYDFYNTLAYESKYEDGTILDKSISGLHRYMQKMSTVAVTEKEVQEMGKSVSTCSDEDKGEEPPKKSSEEGLLKMKGYQELVEWLNKITAITSTTKKLQKMDKYSDLQKVSSVEFIRPKMLFMKKLLNKEFYVKQTTPENRIIHTMIDFSGSMGNYQSWRNALMTRVFKDTKAANIDLYNCFWNTHLHSKTDLKGKEKFIKSEQDLETHVLDKSPRGDDNMGRCVVEKLQELQRSSVRQYLLCISDGTGSIEDDAQSKEIYRLASEKNIELKFALFSSQNDMYSIKKEDTFYILKR